MRTLEAFGGTLIVVVPCQEGLVICADRLGTNAKAGTTTEIQKLFQIGPAAAFAATGTTTLQDLNDDSFQYDVCKIIDEFFREQQFDYKSPLAQALAKHLTNRFNNFFWKFTHLPLPKLIVEDKEYRHFFRLIFCYLDGNESAKVNVGDFFYDSEIEQFKLGINPVTEDELKGIAPMVFGDRVVFDELRNQTDKRFDKARNDPTIKRFITGKAAAGEVTEKEALQFAKKLILISSKMTPVISGKPTTIGEVVDCGIIRIGKGFEWICQRSVIS